MLPHSPLPFELSLRIAEALIIVTLIDLGSEAELEGVGRLKGIVKD